MTSADLVGETRVVALGGGHGLAASLAALRQLTTALTAVVTVADNGGSSGRLRTEFGSLPPGDLRMALAALCGDDRWGQTWARVLQHRFDSDGELSGHALGNLLIIALWELLDDHVLGLDWVGGLLGARGRVLPMSTEPLDIVGRAHCDPGDPSRLVTVRGQVEVATTAGLVEVELDPAHPHACPEAVRAVRSADVVVLGPGSWYTSVLPHLLVPELRDAICDTAARVVLTLNLAAQPGETEGLSPADHLAVLRRHAPDLHVDAVVVDESLLEDEPSGEFGAMLTDLGAELVVSDVRTRTRADHHDPAKLAAAYARLVHPS